jgi:hypothetical protein
LLFSFFACRMYSNEPLHQHCGEKTTEWKSDPKWQNIITNISKPLICLYDIHSGKKFATEPQSAAQCTRSFSRKCILKWTMHYVVLRLLKALIKSIPAAWRCLPWTQQRKPRRMFQNISCWNERI